jgi:transcription antitermination factor NusB
MGKRRRARELAMQVLFALDLGFDDPYDAFDLVTKNFKSDESDRPFSRQLVLGVCEKREEVDRLIAQASRNWRIKRMSHVDRSILRLATFEILFMEDIPPKVSIDEAVEMGKKFGAENSGNFINGVLDNIYNSTVQHRTQNTEDG